MWIKIDLKCLPGRMFSRMGKTTSFYLLLLVFPVSLTVQAQNANKVSSNKFPATGVCCQQMNSLRNKPTTIVEKYLVPEFYHSNPIQVADTTFSYDCYDRRDSLLNMDTVMDFALVKYLSLIKSYTDREHTYKDKDGIRQPLPVSYISRRYDRLGNSRWMCITYPGNKYAELKEYQNEIVRTDTFSEDVKQNVKVLSIYNYYKVRASK